MAYLNDIRASHHSVSGAGSVLVTVLATLGRWVSISRERRDLGELSLSQLDDIGVSARQAQTEAARPFWASSAR